MNRGSEPAVYLEISNRDPLDEACLFRGGSALERARMRAAMFTRKDGSKF